MIKKGKLIVIDGSDGVGKATQTKLLVKELKKRGRKVKTLDFPQYDKNFFGKFIGECLSGEYGDFVNLNPHITSVLYAADRFESVDKLNKWLSRGHLIILDRYVSANQIHQGGKIFNTNKRKVFLHWLDVMEYEVFKLPKPNNVIYLDVPVKTSVRLLKKSQQKKQYQKNGKEDLVEQDMDYLENARKSALWLAKENKNWIRIQCIKNNKLRSIEDIHSEVINLIK
jgi:dTMP kinase